MLSVRQLSNQKIAVQKKRQLSGGNQKDMFGSMSSEKKVYRENSTKNAQPVNFWHEKKKIKLNVNWKIEWNFLVNFCFGCYLDW